MVFVLWQNISSSFLFLHIKKKKKISSLAHLFLYRQDEMNGDKKKHIKKKGENAGR